MRRGTRFVALLACCLLLGPAVLAEDAVKETSKEEAIRELLRVNGSAEMGIQMMEQMAGSFQQALPHVPSEVWTAFFEEVDPNELIDLLVPIYEKHLTREEIDAAIEFFSSPLGKSLIEKQPLIMQDSFVAGQQWGAAVGMRAQKKVQEWMASQDDAPEEGPAGPPPGGGS